MSFKRDPENYPFVNGEWIDKFAEKLIKNAAENKTTVPSAPNVVQSASPTATTAPATPPAVSTGTVQATPQGQSGSPQKKETVVFNTVQNIVNDVQLNGNTFKLALDKQKKDPLIILSIPLNDQSWSFITSEAQRILTSNFSNIDALKNAFQNYVIKNGKQSTEKELQDFLTQTSPSISNTLTNEQRSNIILSTENYSNSAETNGLIERFKDNYYNPQNTKTVDQIFSELVKSVPSITVEDQNQLKNIINNIVSQDKAGTSSDRAVYSVTQLAIKYKADPNYSNLDDASIVKKANDDYFLSSNPTAGEDIKRRIENSAYGSFEQQLNDLKNMFEQIKIQSETSGKDIISVIDSQLILNEKKEILKSISNSFTGQNKEFSTDEIKNKLKKTVDTLYNVLQNKLNINSLLELLQIKNIPEEAKSGISAIQKYVTRVNFFYETIKQLSLTFSKQAGNEKVLIKESAIFDDIKEKFVGKNWASYSHLYDSRKGEIAGIAESISDLLLDFEGIKTHIETSGIVDQATKQYLEKLTAAKNNIDQQVPELSRALGFQIKTSFEKVQENQSLGRNPHDSGTESQRGKVRSEGNQSVETPSDPQTVLSLFKKSIVNHPKSIDILPLVSQIELILNPNNNIPKAPPQNTNTQPTQPASEHQLQTSIAKKNKTWLKI